MSQPSGRRVWTACLQLLRAASQLQPTWGPPSCQLSRSFLQASTPCTQQLLSAAEQCSTGFRGLATATDTSKRFYKHAHVVPSQDQPGHWTVTLDSRPVRTPAKKVLSLPSQALALAVAAEWQWQPTGKPQMHTMPLMSLAATALDQPKPRDKVIENLLKYVHTDTTCCRLEPGTKVALRQTKVHDPLLRWVAGELGWQMVASHDLFGPYQSDQTVETVERYLEGLDPYQLAAMDQITATSKSLVIAAALLHGHISIQDAFTAARVEEDCQMEEWGSVEAGHDLDIADITTRIASASVFLRLLSLQ